MIWKLLIILFILSTPLAYFWVHREQPTLIDPTISQSRESLIENVKVEPIFNTSTPSIDQIFSDNHLWEATLSATKIRTVIATGDIIPARAVNVEILQHKDFNWPYLKTYQLTQNADITFSNLESPEIKNCPVTNEGMIFCGDYRNIEGLKFAGVDVVSLANNHAGNHDQEGVKETIEHLETTGIDTTGTNFSNLVVKNIRGTRFAFLGFDDITKEQPGISNAEEGKIRTEIVEAKKQVDIVIVTFHWGVEYRDQPDERQKYLGHLAIDLGADLVIGNHPHWIQPVEIYKGKLITYAHGNFVFDQEWSQKTKEGVIGKYTFYDSQLIDVEYLPVQIDNYGQPSFLVGNKKKSILENMKNGSLQLSFSAN